MRLLLDGLFGVAASGLICILAISLESERVRYPVIGLLFGGVFIGLLVYGMGEVYK